MLSKTPWVLVILFGLISSYSLFHSGLPPTHDGEYHVVRFYEFFKTFSGGSIYPRWAPDLNLGYGVPLFNYVYPFSNYFSLVTHIIGLSFIDSFKINLMAATLFGAIFTYLWVKNFYGQISGLVAAVFYSFSPYRLLDVFVRGSVGEIWAMAFFPALMWATEKTKKTNGNFYLIISGTFFALIIISHNILALLFSLFYVAYSLLEFSNTKRIKNSAITVLLGIGFSAIFWLPALLERNLVVGLTTYNVKENFVELYQLLIPSWGTGFSGGDLSNQMSFQIGLANLSVMFLSLFLIIKNFRKKTTHKKIVVFFMISFFTSVFLTMSYSSFVWDVIPLLSYFQFPWRILSLIIILCAFFSGFVLGNIKSSKIKIVLAILLILFAMSTTAEYIKIPYYLERNDSYYFTRPNFIDGTNSVGNAFNTKWFSGVNSKPKTKLELPDAGFVIKREDKPTLYKYYIMSNSEEKAILNVAYFPGWTLYVNGKKQKIFLTDKGLISFKVNKGINSILIKLENTLIEELAAIITIISIFTACAVLSRSEAGIIKKKL